MSLGTSDYACWVLVLGIITMVIVYFCKETSQKNHSPLRGDAFAYRANSVEDNKKRYGSHRNIREENWSDTFQSNNFDKDPFDAGMVNEWRDKPIKQANGDDSPFTWQANEEECSVSSLKAPSKERARIGANNSPDRSANYSSDRARARMIGQSPNAALRQRSILKINADTPIVFGDSSMRQIYINEHGGHCFDKAENLDACYFDRCGS